MNVFFFILEQNPPNGVHRVHEAGIGCRQVMDISKERDDRRDLIDKDRVDRRDRGCVMNSIKTDNRMKIEDKN